MNRNNVLAALDDEGVQALAAQCHTAMTAFAGELATQDFIVAAVERAESEGDCTLADVEAHLTQRLAGFMLALHDLREYRTAFTQWLATDGNELGEVRAPPVNFQ